MRPVIILFAKAPLPGHVKTRLIPPLTPQSAAHLHSAFVLDTIERLQAFSRDCDIELHTDLPTCTWAATQVHQALQHEGDLGLKMFEAMSRALSMGRPRVVIAGTDAPTLPVPYLRTLLESSADVALGPAEDGGYYAIACRRVHPLMFRDVVWSSSGTLDGTVEAASKTGLTVELGPVWWDIDTAIDLERLVNETDLPNHTAQILEKLCPQMT